MSTPSTQAIAYASPDFSFAFEASRTFAPGTDRAIIAQAQIEHLQQAEAFLADIEGQLNALAKTRPLTNGEADALEHARAWRRQAAEERAEVIYREALIACDRPSQHIANAIRWNAICTDPDWCEVGGTPVAFDSVAVIENPVVASPDVKAQDVPVYRVDDMHHGVKAVAGRSLGSGSAAGSGFVKVLTGASTVFVNNKPVARNASAAQINCGPDGLGGVRGALLTEERPPNPPPAPPQQTPPPSPAGQRTSPHLEELQRQEAALKAQLFDLEEYVRFRDVYPVVDQIQGTPGTWTDYAAQAGRGVLKAGLAVGDGVTTLANLALNASQRQSPAGMVLTTVQAQIAAENIRLGNTTLGSVGAAAGNMLLSVFVPPEAQTAWQRGDHLEAGVTTLGTLLTGGGLRRLFKDPPSPSNVPDNAGAAGRGLDEASGAGRAAENVEEAVAASGPPGVHVSPRKLSLREQYLGRTPGKESRTGREVFNRMRDEGAIRQDPLSGRTEFRASDGNWYDLRYADMSHRIDAVTWWNSTGRHLGARSPEVRAWMLDSRNYVLDHLSLNRSAGARLRQTYLPPTRQ